MQQIIWMFRVFLAGILGMLVGYERSSRSKEAGVKTHCIVALASSMMMLLSKYGFSDSSSFDAARIASQAVTGIGFLGAGIIFVKNDVIQGLTTAAGIWATCGIGMCIGSGMYSVGVFTAILIVLIQLYMHKSKFFSTTHITTKLNITVEEYLSVSELANDLSKLKLVGTDFKVIDIYDDGSYSVELYIVVSEDFSSKDFTEKIKRINGVKKFRVLEE